MMQPVSDYVLVRVDSEFNDKLFIKGEGGKEVELVLNTRYRPTHNVKISAEVIAVPHYLSGNDVAYEEYLGLPRPLAYRNHDHISKQMAELPPKYRNLKESQIPYQCGSYEPRMVSCKDVDVQSGDIVYFHYNQLLNEENFIERQEDGALIYRIRYSSIFCRVRLGEITCLNGYVLVSEVYDEDVEDIIVDGKVINKGKTKNGLVVELDSKARTQRGKLEHIGAGVGDDVRTVSPGELILFRAGSEFKNTIEGREYMVMRHWDIVAIVMDDQEVAKYAEIINRYTHDSFDMLTVKPVGDYVMVRPEEIPVSIKVETVKYDPNASHQEFKPGQIFVLPDTVEKTKKKGTAYGIGSVLSVGERASVPHGARIWHGKSAYFLYHEDLKMAFVKSGDVFGWMN